MSRSILKNTAIFAAFTVLAQVLAVLRDVVLVRVVGVGQLLDTYYMAFKIPDLMSGFYMIFLGSVVFVPLITKAQKEGGTEEVIKKLREIGSFVFLIIFGMFAIIYLALPFLATILVPQWSVDQQLQMISLSRILLFSQLIFPLGIISGALCMVYGRVGYTAISSALYNLGILLGAWFLFPTFGIYGVAYGVVLGSILFFLVQAMPKDTRDVILQFRPQFHFPTVKHFVQTNISRFFSVFLWQIFLLLLLYVASKYGESAISVFNIAYGIDVSLISIIGASVSSVMLPIFARLHLDGDEVALKDNFNSSTFYTLYISLIISFLLFLFSESWMQVLYYFSKVEPDKLAAIAAIFGIFMLSLPLQNCFDILRKFLYSTDKIKAVSIFMIFFMMVLMIYIFIIKYFLPDFDSINTIAYGFLVSNITTITIFSIIYKKELPIKYKEIFHKLLPMLIGIPLSALLWYTLSTHTTYLQANNVIFYLLKNVSLITVFLLLILYLLRDSVVRVLVNKFILK
jgi:putative peptidoglycan lipid II flippase